MGMDLAFFAAPDDERALEAERRPGGPLGWPEVTGSRRSGLLRREPVVTELGPADGFGTRGYDPVLTTGTLEALLTGRDVEAVLQDPRSGGAPGGDDEVLEDRAVVTMTDALRDALAGADDARLAEVVGPWSRTEELQQPGWEEVTPDEHLEFLRALRDLARRAHDAGHRLYCWFAV